jgi:hypothetical protein
MTTTIDHLSPWTCLDALSDHPRYAEAARCLHPALRHLHPIVKDVDEWGLIELQTYVAIAGEKELWIVPTSTAQRAIQVRQFVRQWAAACGYGCRRPLWQSGCMVLRFSAVAS